MTDIGTRIASFLAAEPDLGLQVGEADSLVASGLLDSVGVLSLVAFIEEEFDVELDAAEVNLDNFDTVAAMVRLVDAHRAGA